jgi:Lon protease-like protein
VIPTAEKTACRERFIAFRAQYTKYASRCAWLADQDPTPELDEFHARCETSGRKFGEMGDALADWLDCDAADLLSLVERAAAAAVPNGHQERDAR